MAAVGTGVPISGATGTQPLALPIALAAFVAGRRVGFHDGWRVLRARLGGRGRDAIET